MGDAIVLGRRLEFGVCSRCPTAMNSVLDSSYSHKLADMVRPVQSHLYLTNGNSPSISSVRSECSEIWNDNLSSTVHRLSACYSHGETNAGLSRSAAQKPEARPEVGRDDEPEPWGCSRPSPTSSLPCP